MTATPARRRLYGDYHPLKSTGAFAYLRRLPGMDDAAVRRVAAELQTFATRRRFGLAGVHVERHRSERLETWVELIMNCRSDGVTDVLVPNAGHFHPDPLVAAFMREELAEKIGGTVWLVSEAGGAATGERATHHGS
jgi:hypothetical protein